MKKYNCFQIAVFLLFIFISNLKVLGVVGDINGSGRVDGEDLKFLSHHYDETTNALNESADLNSDGVIDTNDFIILNTNFGKTENGGAAAWVSDNLRVYKIGVDKGRIRSRISGFPGTPILNDINPDTGEAWVICIESNLIYVISPFVPLEYNVISNSGYHYTYYVPGIKTVSLSSGTNAAVCATDKVYYWHEFPDDYDFTNDISQTYFKEFLGMGALRNSKIFDAKYIWVQTEVDNNNYHFYKLYLSAPEVYNVQSGGVYHSYKKLYNYDSYCKTRVDGSGNLYIKRDMDFYKLSSLSMGITAERRAGQYIQSFSLNPADNSVWYSFSNEKKLCHVTPDMGELLLSKTQPTFLNVQGIDSDRKHIWGLDGDNRYNFNRIKVLNYLGNLDIEISDPDFNYLSSLKLFLPKIFSGYPVAKIEADVTEGNYPLTVIFSATNSYDEDGTIVNYAWDFNGDGIFDTFGSELKVVTNIYEIPGKYPVMLKVTDDDGLENYDSDLTIGVGPLTVIGSGTPTNGSGPLAVTFTAEIKDGLGDGNMENYQWDFDGDGVFDYVSLTTPDTSFTYSKSGDYEANLKVLSKAGEIGESTVKIKVNATEPICSLSVNPSEITEAQQITFYINYSDGDGTVVMLSMDFDDDGIFEYNCELNSPNHNLSVYKFYGTPGTYNVKAFVIDNGGQSSSTNEVEITFTPSNYELVITPESVNVIGSIVCTTKPSVISISPNKLTWTINKYNFSNKVNETYLTTEKTETRLDVIDLNEPGSYKVSLSYPECEGIFNVFSLDKPIANYVASPESGFAPLKVNYDASSSSSGIIFYEWDFDGAYFYDDAESDYGIFTGDGQRTSEQSYEGNYSWELPTIGGMGSRYYKIPENKLLKISFFCLLSNLVSTTLQVTIHYEKELGNLQTKIFSFLPTTNWTENIFICKFNDLYSGGRFFMSFGGYNQNTVFLDNILVTEYANEFNIDSSSSSPTVSHTFQKAGAYITLLRVTDEKGNKCYARKEIVVNPKPLIKIISPTSGGSYGATISFTAEAENPESIIAYFWDYDGDGQIDFVSTELEQKKYTYKTGGGKTANLYAELTDGTMLTSTVTFTVNLDIAPEIVGYSVTPLKSRQNFYLSSILAVNFNDSSFDYTVWQYNNSATTTNRLLNESIYFTGIGVYTQKVTVFALNGLSSSTQSVFRVLPSRSIMISATASPNPAFQNQPVELNGNLTYYNGAVAASFSWDFNNDGTIDWTSTTSPLVTNVYNEAGVVTSKVSVVTTNGTEDSDYIYLTIKEEAATNTSRSSYFFVGTSVEQATNYATISNTDILQNISTNFYGSIYQTERNNYDGSYWTRSRLGHPSYANINYHFDKDMNVIGVLTNTDKLTIQNIDLAPSDDSDAAWTILQVPSWPYVKYLNKYNGMFQPDLLISNPPVRDYIKAICGLPNDYVCVLSRYSSDELQIINSSGEVTKRANVLDASDVRYNPVSSNIWVSFNDMIYIYSLDLVFYGMVDTETRCMDINPVDGTVLIYNYGEYSRYDGYGNLIRYFSGSGATADDISVDVSDGGFFNIRNNYNIRKYNVAFSEVRTYNSIPFYNFNTIKANGPYFETSPQNRPKIFGSCSTVTNENSIDASFTISASSLSGISSYEWDFDGDGTFDYFSATTGSTTHEYTKGGENFPVCRIIDNNGVAIADTHLQPIKLDEGQATPIVQLFLTPEIGATSPVTVAISTYVDKGTISYIILYVDDYQIYNAYTHSNPFVYNHNFNLAGDYTIKAYLTIDEKTHLVEKEIHINSAPPVPIINYTAAPKSAPSVVSVSASSSYSSGSSISYIQWDLNNDGIFDRYSTDLTETFYINFPTQTSTTVKLRVTNSEGIYSDTNATIVVTNSGPKGTFTASQTRGIAPFYSDLTFGAIDPDGTVVGYLLDADGKGTIDYTSSVAGTYRQIFTNVPGYYNPKLYSVDNFGVTGVVSCSIQILDNGSAFAFASATPNSGNPSLAVLFEGGCTNINVTLYEWDFDGDDIYEWNSTSNGTVSYVYETKGKYNPKFKVTATNGTQDSVQLTISVGAFPIPQPRAMPQQAIAPQTIKFTADGIDPDGTILYFYWDFNESGSFAQYDPITDTPSTYNYSLPGTYKSLLIAKDDSGLQATGEVTVTILSQEMPTAFASASPDLVSTGELVSFYGFASDWDGNIVQLKWLFGDGAEDSSTLDGQSTHSYSSTGIYTATFIATDNDGNNATATTFITVLPGNFPRIIGSATPDSGNVPLAVSFNIDAIPTDALIVNYEIDFGDGSEKFSKDSASTFLHNYTEIGTYYPILTVTDSTGRKSSKKIAILVEGTMAIGFNKEKFDPTLSETVAANIFLPFDAFVTLKVNNKFGVTKKTLLANQSLPLGYSTVDWDGKDELGNYVSDGAYYYVAAYQKAGNNYVYDPSYDVPPMGSPYIDNSTVANKPFYIYSDNPLMIGFTLSYRSEMSLYMVKNPTGRNVTPHLYNRVKTIYHHTPLASGSQYARWDTTDDNGGIAVDPFSAADYFFAVWNWELPVNTVIVDAKPKITDITIEGEPNYYSAGLNPYRSSVTNELLISYSVSKPVSKVDIKIMKFNGQIVRTFVYNNVSKGIHSFKWDAKADNGYLTTPDSYKLAISAEDSEGNIADVVYDLFKLMY